MYINFVYQVKELKMRYTPQINLSIYLEMLATKDVFMSCAFSDISFSL